ncbi:hypothetical protein AV530_002895 [Patagioenas fasciata monilis]|uniref:Uncharacterized protein n=1 Tax=Patagioenas fasciata monilis TaxID=372326 RepID=A0A1V4K9R5_PATFA|nr:hypothetical protein AV530_002895 [Patagioenas fasciata monilis]
MMSWDLQLCEMKGIKRNPLALGKASNTQSTTQLGNSKATDPATQPGAFQNRVLSPSTRKESGKKKGGKSI